MSSAYADPPVGTSEAAVENGYLRPQHLSSREWAALPQLVVGGTADWQDVSVRPVACTEAPTSGFTVEVCTHKVLEGDHGTPEGCVTAAGPHPRELLPAGSEVALDVGRMAVYLARPFTPAEALAWTELLLLEAGVPVRSLEEVGVDEFYAGLARRGAT